MDMLNNHENSQSDQIAHKIIIFSSKIVYLFICFPSRTDSTTYRVQETALLILEDLLSMLHLCPESMLEAYPVSSRVNNPRNNDSGCIARMVV